jgi:hypothetical protein
MADMSVHIRNGTPLHGESKCQTCANAHIERGYGECEQVVICRATYPEHRVRFRVRECSGYNELERQSLKQMEDIAWVVEPRGSKRKAGFVHASEVRKDEDEIELILDKEN